MIPFPVFVILKIKNIWSVCQAANAVDTPGHQHPSCHARESNQNNSDFRKSRLGFVLDTKLMDHPYTRWFLWILSKLRKKKTNTTITKNPQEPEMITLKLRCVCSWLCLLPLVSVHARRYLREHWLCSLLDHTKGAMNK